MSISNNSLGRRLLATLGAATVAFGGFIGMSSAAHAAPEYGNIKEDADGSIIIHKHENQVDTEIVGDPNEASTIPSPGVENVTFTVYDIVDANGAKIDLTVPGNWDYLEDLEVSADGTQLTGGPGEPEGPWAIGSQVGEGTTN